MAIPVVDLAVFRSGNEASKKAFVETLGKAFEEVGFVAVKNHGIPDDLIADLYKYVQQFFSMSADNKRNMKSPVWPASAVTLLSVRNMRKAVMLLI